jgi:hypothetical protein
MRLISPAYIRSYIAQTCEAVHHLPWIKCAAKARHSRLISILTERESILVWENYNNTRKLNGAEIAMCCNGVTQTGHNTLKIIPRLSFYTRLYDHFAKTIFRYLRLSIVL